MSNTFVAIVLVGGLGTRLRSRVSDRPKPLADIGGIPFLQILLDSIFSQHPRKVVLCAGYQSEKVYKFVETLPVPEHICIEVVEEAEPLGTGGAVINAIRHNDFDDNERIVTFNGDTLPGDWSVVLKSTLPAIVTVKQKICGDKFVMPVVGLASRGSRVLLGYKNFVNASAGEYEISSGVCGFFRHQVPSTFAADGCSMEDVMALMTEMPVKVLGVGGFFIDIGTPETLDLAKKSLRGG